MPLDKAMNTDAYEQSNEYRCVKIPLCKAINADAVGQINEYRCLWVKL